MWLQLQLVWKFMGESGEGILNVSWHGEMYLAVFDVPVQCESKVLCPFPVSVNFVVLLDDACKMDNIVFLDVLHSKKIDDKGEADGAPVMSPVSWCDHALPVACFVEVFGEKFLCNDAGL